MANKFPPNTFSTNPIRWTFHAGGSVAHIPGSRSIACERCFATAGAGIGHQAIADFLRAHCGPTCGAIAATARKR